MFKWLLNHLIPCPFKAFTGLDCPGCGFQRSVIALFYGNLQESWSLYPPTIPLLILFITVGIIFKLKLKNRFTISKVLALVVGNFVLMSYLIKIL